jgi:hypothetical protein
MFASRMTGHGAADRRSVGFLDWRFEHDFAVGQIRRSVCSW